MTRVGDEFPVECPSCGGDNRLIAFRLRDECETILGLRTLGNLRLGPSADWGELVQAHDERDTRQASSDELPVIAIHLP